MDELLLRFVHQAIASILDAVRKWKTIVFSRMLRDLMNRYVGRSVRLSAAVSFSGVFTAWSFSPCLLVFWSLSLFVH